MKIHYKKVHTKIFACRLCPKTFQNVTEVKHHLTLEHRGMSQDQLKQGSDAVQTKKQLSDYINNEITGINLDCPECFEIFPTVDKLEKHRIKNHDMGLTIEAHNKLKKIIESDEKEGHQCEICKNIFLGLIVCMMDGESVVACMNCYESHYGPNALIRLTIGTPNEMIKKMKIPIV